VVSQANLLLPAECCVILDHLLLTITIWPSAIQLAVCQGSYSLGYPATDGQVPYNLYLWELRFSIAQRQYAVKFLEILAAGF